MRRQLFTIVAAAITCSAMLAAQGQGGGAPAAAPAGGQAGAARGPQPPPLVMTTTSFEDGGVIPPKFAGQTGVSPELKWAQVPAGTQSFVLLMHDPDGAPQRGVLDVTHWVVWNIPGTSTGLPEGVPQRAELPDGTRQVSLRNAGYMGPGAAATAPFHHYTLELYALDIKLDIPAAAPAEAAATRLAVLKAMDGHVIGKAALVGRFHQQPQ